MRSLIVEDEFTARMQLKYFLEGYGKCDVAVNVNESIEAFKMAYSSEDPYDLICFDIKLPGEDGINGLKKIKDIEKEMKISIDKKVKTFMTSAMEDFSSVKESYYEDCDEYIRKPIDRKELEGCLSKHGLIK